MRTHYDVMREVSNEGWDFNQQFIRAIIHAKAEKKDKPALAYAFGAEVEETGKYFCPDCDQYLTDPCCDGFEKVVRDTLKREVIRPYIERHCPDCETKIESRETIREIETTEAQFFSNEEDLEDSIPTQTTEKTRYNPCGCLHEIGGEQILWDLDKERVEKEVNVLRYDGPVFNY